MKILSILRGKHEITGCYLLFVHILQSLVGVLSVVQRESATAYVPSTCCVVCREVALASSLCGGEM